MNRLIRYYNQNRGRILIAILVIAFIITITQLLNEQAKKENQRVNNNTEIKNIIQTNNTNIQGSNQNTQNAIQNIVQNNSNTVTSTNIIDKFINYCNEGQIQNAYDLISNDCKKVLFPSIEVFKLNYFQKVFTQKRSYKSEESMYGKPLYKVTYYADLLSNGGYNQEGNLQDYIMLVQQDGKNKISLNKFLYTEKINKSENKNSIFINVLQKYVFLDYEIYQIQVSNKTSETILLCENEKNEQIYLMDERGMKYSSNIDEYEHEKSIINNESTTILNLKFNKIYNKQVKAQSIVFSNIVINNENSEKVEINIEI